MSSVAAILMPLMAKLPPVQYLGPGLIRVLGQNPSFETFQGTNSYIIDSGARHKTVIDTSDSGSQGYVKNMLEIVKSLGKNAYVKNIILTHWHADHVGAAAELQHALKLANGTQPTIFKMPSNAHHDSVDFQFESLSEGSHIDELEVLHTPGHTDDHVSLYWSQRRCLFTGDMILGSGSGTSFEYLNSYMKSLRRAEALAKDGALIQIHPGHGDVVRDPVVKTREWVHHRMERIADVFKALRIDEWIREKDLLDSVYIEVAPQLLSGALSNMRQALIYLEKHMFIESCVPDVPTDFDQRQGPSFLWKRISSTSSHIKFEFDE